MGGIYSKMGGTYVRGVRTKCEKCTAIMSEWSTQLWEPFLGTCSLMYKDEKVDMCRTLEFGPLHKFYLELSPILNESTFKYWCSGRVLRDLEKYS